MGQENQTVQHFEIDDFPIIQESVSVKLQCLQILQITIRFMKNNTNKFMNFGLTKNC